MEKRSLGVQGLEASVVGLGCNNFGMKIDLAATRAVLDTAIDAGINFFDTADIYGNKQSEDFIGQVLGPRRKNIVLATKFGGAGWMNRKSGQRWGTREYIVQCLEDSLRRLRTDWIDLYQYHFPDPATPLEETLAALDEVLRQGKVRAIGSSNLSGEQIAQTEAYSAQHKSARFVTAQNEWSLLKRDIERDVIPACDRYQVGQLPFFPLASGMLTGKYHRGVELVAGSRLATFDFAKPLASDDNFTKIEALQSFARKRGHTLLELAMSWLTSHPCVTSVIAGATTPEQVRANATAANWKLSAAEMAEVNALVPLAPV
jgi:aryl-alcohol dehydrogenase-like predicted oxidoreductase